MHFDFRNRKGDQDEVRLSQQFISINFQLDFQYSGDAFFYDLQMAFLASIFANNLLCIFCVLGQVFRTKLIDLSDTIYQSEWYRYPRSVQRLLHLMVMKSQQPFDLSAFGIIALNLENYVGVSEAEYYSFVKYSWILFQLLKWTYSAYMLLRSFD